MAAPEDVKNALDRLAAQVNYLTQIVLANHPDQFLFEEWQQPDEAAPPWLHEKPDVFRSQATVDLT